MQACVAHKLPGEHCRNENCYVYRKLLPVDVSQHSVEGTGGIQVALQHQVREARIVVQRNVGTRHFGGQQVACPEGVDGSQSLESCFVLSQQSVHPQQAH